MRDARLTKRNGLSVLQQQEENQSWTGGSCLNLMCDTLSNRCCPESQYDALEVSFARVRVFGQAYLSREFSKLNNNMSCYWTSCYAAGLLKFLFRRAEDGFSQLDRARRDLTIR